MSSLDQSLEEIISSKPKKQFRKNNNKQGGNKVSKKTTTPVSKKTPTGPKKSTPKAKELKGVSSLDISYATKVIVNNLPTDIKQDAIKDFFASQVGGVQSVSLTYNERGQSKGIATVIFKSSANATKAVEKYNGAPIDGGVRKLRLELIVDPTKKPLANRILANTNVKDSKPAATKKANGKKAAPAPAKAQSKAQPKKANKPKAKKPAKKTVEQLDQEMADYFEKKD